MMAGQCHLVGYHLCDSLDIQSGLQFQQHRQGLQAERGRTRQEGLDVNRFQLNSCNLETSAR